MSKQTFSVSVPVDEIDPKTMFLHEHLADGEMNGIKFTVDRTIGVGNLLIRVDGRLYDVKIQSVISSVIKKLIP
ncbi:MAG: hypothetical protein WAV09_04325 [Minisyncoccia bacterium]